MAKYYKFACRLVILSLAIGMFWFCGTARGDFTVGKAANMGSVINSPTKDNSPSISADGLELYFGSQRSGGYGWWDLWVSTRPDINAEWESPTNLGPEINDWRFEGAPCLSYDGLSLYYNATRDWSFDIYLTMRATRGDDWGAPVKIRPFDSGYGTVPAISSDGLQLFFADYDELLPGGFGSADLWTLVRPTLSDPWGSPVNLGQLVNSPSVEYDPGISADGLVLLFESDRPGGLGGSDIWMTIRKTTDDNWDAPVNLGSTINTVYGDGGPSISADGRTLYFHSSRPGGHGETDLWQAPIEPVVDFNGDGRVDDFEISTMADRWGTDDALCDIGPMPWGDGLVNVEDLKALAEYIGKDTADPTLVAHWTLDETEAQIAHDGVGVNDGILLGDPVWEPNGGAVEGALGFDGLDDVVLVNARVLDPADGPFSILAWTQGGAPGQSIISQVDGVSWLLADPSEGALMTELSPPAGRVTIPPLRSSTVITGGHWHRIAFVWDGATRAIYVDETLVAEDVQASLASCEGGLNFGCDGDMTLGKFWSGLIDDVRIYNRAVRP